MFKYILFSFGIFLTCIDADNTAYKNSNGIINIIEQSIKFGKIDRIMLLIHPNMTYNMCGYFGNYESFPLYLKKQINTLVDIKSQILEAKQYKEGEAEYLTFVILSDATYYDKSRVEGLAEINAIRNSGTNLFRIIKISQRCRVVRAHHRLFRLFTYHDLYDY